MVAVTNTYKVREPDFRFIAQWCRVPVTTIKIKREMISLFNRTVFLERTFVKFI